MTRGWGIIASSMHSRAIGRFNDCWVCACRGLTVSMASTPTATSASPAGSASQAKLGVSSARS